MNRGVFQSFPVHQMVGGSPICWWDLNNMGPPSTDHQQTSPLFPSSSSSTTPSSSSSSTLLPQYTQSSSLQAMTTWHDHNQELPESWSQLLLGGLVEEEDRCSYTPNFQAKRILESWDDQMLYPSSATSHMVDAKSHELSDKGYNIYGQGNMISEEIQAARSSWSQILPNSSPRSCVTTSLNSSMLDFSNNKADHKRHNNQLDLSSECNSTPTGSPYKKPRVQASTAQSTFKVRKEKLGDRITALHQLVSPFGKTDTASVLLEAIGYIRFLQSQIEALSSPYLGSNSTGSGGNIKHSAEHGERNCIFPEDPGQDGVDEPMDLKSRGLCLVPVSFTMHVGNDNAADYWAPTFGGGFR